MGRLPTADTLIKRGVTVETPICGHCRTEEEDITHVLWRCSFVKTVWYWIFRWCEILVPVVHNVGELLSFIDSWGNNQNRRKILLNIYYRTLWMMWKARCDWVLKISDFTNQKWLTTSNP